MKGKQDHFSTHRQTNGGYADDLIAITNTRQDILKAADIITQYSMWGGLLVNIPKSAVTARIMTTNDTPQRNITNSLGYIGLGKNNAIIPILQPHESYKYMGIWINMNLNWATEYRYLSLALKEAIGTIIGTGVRATQKLQMLKNKVFPLLIYHTSLAAFSEAQTKS